MCKICRIPSLKLQIGKISYEQCPECGFLAKSASHFLTEEKEYQRYLQHNNDLNDDYLNYQRQFLKLINPYLGSRVLDFGCGESHLLASLIGCDYYDKYFFPNNFLGDNYDTIIMEEVIEHLKEPLKELTLIDKLLVSGGKLIIRTQLLDSQVDLTKWWYLRDQTHVSFFTKKTFSKICKLFNLQIIYCNDFDLIILQKA